VSRFPDPPRGANHDLPEETDLFTLSPATLNDITRLLNGHPRQTPNWRTPEETMVEAIAKFSNRVAHDG